MPEVMIISRFYYKDNGITEKWWQCFNHLARKISCQKKLLKQIIFLHMKQQYRIKIFLNLLVTIDN